MAAIVFTLVGVWEFYFEQPDEPNKPKEAWYDIEVDWNAQVYAIIQFLLGWFNENMILRLTKMRNFRYRYEYNDCLAFNMGIIEFINFYVPMLVMGFLNGNLKALWNMLLTVLITDQLKGFFK